MHQKNIHGTIPPLNRPVILASASPRRAGLLAGIGINFDVHPAEIPEPDL
ncbi:MAG: hypothetical protein GWN61_21460, partial [candidate division Zixibacteria bacterium]|nr:Maf-like protein [Gammaproteobacteria bacterium]NIR52113.1 Maf-like protein [candidate division KSB1 bacterium]NIR67008.1 Maf-like protein [candidate division Zixibacteria bacterium]NIS48430.1 Maf-like protein [candidate division Zixibacteria bacterium]NIT74324.1 Maf-like protein [candidate division KSB1 bacterium]